VSELTEIRLRNHRSGRRALNIRVIGKGRKEKHIKNTAYLYGAIRSSFGGTEYLFETAGGKAYRRAYVSGQMAIIERRAPGGRISVQRGRYDR